MDQQAIEIREQQRHSWNTFSGGWKKWDEVNMEFLKPMGDEIIKRIAPADDQHILDLASGTGEPGLTIAKMLRTGTVTLTDLSEDMLSIARGYAKERDISNIETVVCDASELPFNENSFDAISCRMGFMFFPDMQLAANEIRRVLKPGGRIATSVWNIPEKNFWVTALMGTINKHMALPPPKPGAPGMFRCAAQGAMKEIFERAGLIHIHEQEINTTLKYGTVDQYWDMMTEVGAPIVAALSRADEEMRQNIKEEVYTLINLKYPGNIIAIEASAIVISAEK